MDRKVSMVLLRSIQLSQNYVKTLRVAVYLKWSTTHKTVLNLCYKVLHNKQTEDYIFPSLTRNREGSTV